MSRGTDRLAFITGQARSLPQSAGTHEDDATGSLTSPTEANNQIPSIKPMIETSSEISGNEIEKHVTDSHSSIVPPQASAVERTSDQVGHQAAGAEPRINSRIPTPSQISASISATENIRLLSSIVIALLIVFSYNFDSVIFKYLGSVVGSQPLVSMVLTDLTIIFASLLLNLGIGQVGKEGGWGTEIGNLLELAMLLRKALVAVSIDCSIYAVIIICSIRV